MKLIIVLLSFVFMGAVFGQDKYPSVALGAGVNSFMHDYNLTFRDVPVPNQDCYNDRVLCTYPIK